MFARTTHGYSASVPMVALFRRKHGVRVRWVVKKNKNKTEIGNGREWLEGREKGGVHQVFFSKCWYEHLHATLFCTRSFLANCVLPNRPVLLWNAHQTTLSYTPTFSFFVLNWFLLFTQPRSASALDINVRNAVPRTWVACSEPRGSFNRPNLHCILTVVSTTPLALLSRTVDGHCWVGSEHEPTSRAHCNLQCNLGGFGRHAGRCCLP